MFVVQLRFITFGTRVGICRSGTCWLLLCKRLVASVLNMHAPTCRSAQPDDFLL